MADLFSIAAEEAQGRRRQMLRTAFGPAIAAALADPTRHRGDGQPRRPAVARQGRQPAASIPANASRPPRPSASSAWSPRTCAARCTTAHRSSRPSCPRPASASRASCRRSSTAPCFSIRKPAEVLYRLTDYVAARIMTPRQAEALEHAVRERKNIVVVGGTSSGKTTLVNALLAEVADADDRVVILEDTRELQMRRRRLRRPAHQARRRHPRRPRALDPAPASRPHHRRRGARPRSPRHAQGLEHRPSRRPHHRARQLCRLALYCASSS